MKQRRMKKIESTIKDCLSTLDEAKLTREELVVTLGQILIRSGYSIHWGYESPEMEKPDKIDKEMAEELYMGSPSTGTTLIKVGFDLQEVLLLRK